MPLTQVILGPGGPTLHRGTAPDTPTHLLFVPTQAPLLDWGDLLAQQTSEPTLRTPPDPHGQLTCGQLPGLL